jgi:hypothetical protein
MRLQTYRFTFLLILVAAIAVVTSLYFTQKETEVTVALTVNRISFSLGEVGAEGLFNSLAAKSLSLSSIQDLKLGPGTLSVSRHAQPNVKIDSDWRLLGPQVQTVILALNPIARVNMANVTLNTIYVKQNSTITLTLSESEPHLLTVQVDGGPVTGTISPARSLALSFESCRIQGHPELSASRSGWLRLISKRREEAQVRGIDTGISLTMELEAQSRLSESNIPVAHDLDFTELIEGDLASTITDDGKIIFDELENKEQQKKELHIKANEFVVLGELKHFYITSLKIDKGIKMELHGTVGRLQTGPKGNLRPRLPSLLEWIYSQQRWVLYITASSGIVSAILLLLERLKLIPKADAPSPGEEDHAK